MITHDLVVQPVSEGRLGVDNLLYFLGQRTALIIDRYSVYNLIGSVLEIVLIPKCHRDIVEGFLFKCETDFTEAFPVSVHVAENLQRLFCCASDNLFRCCFLCFTGFFSCQNTKVPCGTLCKTQYRINEDVVLSLVSEMLKAIAEYAKHDRAEFVRVVQEAQSSQQTAEVRKQRTRLATAKQRVSELEVLLCKIYEDNILGKLSDSRYATLDAQYEKEQTELTAEISTLEKAVKSYEKHEKDADRFIALIDKYENFDKLTIAMLNEFIEKILVHERDRKGSIQTTQEVEIYFNFVGRFVPPAFGEVELTPEELEEIRKREERKDRLHQNYLKRKASGAQKLYEDKIKGRKKAEIEAKEAAIRAEDIAKGVFVPVSSLPQREPMKGTQTA